MLRRMNAVQQHRGPDGHAVWVSPSRNIGLGHTRLAVIGVGNGEQPICSEDGNVSVVVNGEFYGHEAIRRDLEKRGHRFRTESDSEIAVHLYEEQGISFLDRLRGEFALILWDERKRVLYAARDRFGIKPLFYTEIGGRTLFASEIKALLEAGKQARWDKESFWDSLFFSVLPDRTWFEGIAQVPAARVLTISDKGMTIAPYWDMRYPRADADYPRDPEAFFDEFEAVFHDSVRLRIRADVSVGAQLSGGTDSTGIVAAAARYATGLHTFTVRFPDSEYDEWSTVQETARQLNLRSTAVNYQDSDLFEFLKPAGFHAEWVQENSHGIARFILSRAIRDSGTKVVLAGEGGDELFAGYGHFQKDLDRALALQAGRAQINAGHRHTGEHDPFRRWRAEVEHVPAWITQRYHEIAQWVVPLLSEDFLAQMRGRDPFAEFLDDGVVGQIKGLSPLHQSMYVFNRTRLPNYILVGERLDMAHSIEVRLPYLDHVLFECVSRMPLDWYRHNGQEKYPLRRALQRLMSPRHLGAKRPFLAPPRLNAAGAPAYRYFLDKAVTSDIMKDQPFFSPRKLQEALRDGRLRLPANGESAEAIWQMAIGVWLMQAQFMAHRTDIGGG